eukprot:2968090-Prorocentrum_lima.AAC.1
MIYVPNRHWNSTDARRHHLRNARICENRHEWKTFPSANTPTPLAPNTPPLGIMDAESIAAT